MARERQGELPGMETQKDRMIHDRAIRYLEADEEYKIAKEARDTARDDLKVAMQKRGVTIYDHREVRVELDESVRVKAKRKGGEEDEAEEEAEE